MKNDTHPLQSHTSPPSQPAASAGDMLTQVGSVLALILLVILFCAWLAKRMGFSAKRINSKSLSISASVSVGQRERVVIVDVDDARLVLGVTAQNITHLHTLPPKKTDDPTDPTAAAADFRKMLHNVTRRPGSS